jgi:nicotinamidase-related amidase
MGKDSIAVNAALLVMDVQTNIISRLEDSRDLVGILKGAIATARAAGMPIIYVGVAFRKDMPEVSQDNKAFSAYTQNADLKKAMEEPWTIYSGIAAQPGDIIVTKRRFSAFTGSDLEVILRGLNVRHLVLTGISTSGVVLSTLREAADKDFRLTVLSDACADTDPDIHTLLLTKIFPRQADVITADEWTARLNGG